ncbi:MAG: flagellar assembly peptidoglycan hydrolase FlgJ [Gammaproteobacteria bacterium]
MIAPTSTDLSSRLAVDTKALGDLKQSAKAGGSDALKGAANQFEAMFINMMMKSMRDATPQDGMLDSQESKTFTSMLDQQMSQKLAQRGIGLADVLTRQLSAQAVNAQALAIGGDQNVRTTAEMPAPRAASELMSTPGALLEPSAVPAGGRNQSPHVRSFQDKLAAHASEAEQATGIPAKFMLGQAALESGWGRREIKHADGSTSHNLFGMKAGAGWKGRTVDAVTTEYVNGRPHTRVEKFRAYDSYADSFKDYARMLSKNPRYEKVIAGAKDAASFAQGLQRAGYATDPMYAAKLTRIIKNNLA